MIDKEYAQKFIYGLHRGRNCAYEECRIIGEAYAIKGEIPEEFWKREIYCEPLMGYEVPLRKAELLSLRKEVIELICKELKADSSIFNWEKKMSPIQVDNFVRLFHGLALMGVEKNDPRIPKMRENVKYNTALAFWLEDDGSIEKWNYIDRLCWRIAEFTK